MSDCLNNEEQIKSNLSENNSDNLTSNLDGNVEISSAIDKINNVTSQMNTLNETSSNLGSEEPLKSKLDFPITGMYSGSQGDNINVEVDNQGFIIRASLKQIKFNSVADFPTIGSERLIYIDATGKSLYGWDSATASYYKLSAGGSGSGDSPTKTSQLENDGDGTSPFSTKNYVDGQVSTIPKFKVEVITELPTENISTSTIYLMRNVKGEDLNIFTEYIYTGSNWEILGEQLPFDLTNYPSMEDWYELVGNERVIRNTEGGFKGGASNTTPDEDVGSGGAIGNLAKAETGFAGGSQSVSWSGGAVGSGSFAGKGFAGGYNAKAYGNNGELSDSIQLGTGYNSNEKTMQVYDDNIYDANTHTLKVKNIELDGEDIKDLMGGSGEYLPLAGGTLNGAVTFEGVTDRVIKIDNSTGALMIEFTRTDKGNKIGFGIGDGGVNRGIWDEAFGDWIFHNDGNTIRIRGKSARPTYNEKDLALYSDISKRTLLWENPSPSSDFNAQTITLSSDDYDFLMVVILGSSSSNKYPITFLDKGKDGYITYSTTSENNQALAYSIMTQMRLVTFVNNKTLTISKNHYGRISAYDGTRQDLNKPYQIYGIKLGV